MDTTEQPPGDSALASESEVALVEEVGEEDKDGSHTQEASGSFMLDSFFATGDLQHQEQRLPQVPSTNSEYKHRRYRTLYFSNIAEAV